MGQAEERLTCSAISDLKNRICHVKPGGATKCEACCRVCQHLCFLPDRSVEIDPRFFASLRMTYGWVAPV